MANFIDATGLHIDSLTDIVTNFSEGYQQIYGADIIITSNTPDGQLINLLSQQVIDLLEVAQMVYANFDPDQAAGVVLDQRCAINNIERRGATYTLQNVQITVDRSLTLQGLDAAANDPNGTGFTVSDNTGNQFILLDTQTPTAGTTTYLFRAKNLGAIQTLPNTITEQTTIVLGVTAVNNTAGPEELGENEETDPQLRYRRARSVANASNGYLNGLLGLVLNLPGVTAASIYENVTNVTDANGIPAHGIWLIVEGGANTDIGNLIYGKKSYGANMKGSASVPIMTPSGAIFTALFDRPTSEDLYIKFDIRTLIAGQTFDTDAIKQYIVNNLSYNIAQDAVASSITPIAQLGIDTTAGIGSGAIENLQISIDGVSYVYFLETTTLDEKWSVTAANIAINVIT